jgi:hypothetical protein
MDTGGQAGTLACQDAAHADSQADPIRELVPDARDERGRHGSRSQGNGGSLVLPAQKSKETKKALKAHIKPPLALVGKSIIGLDIVDCNLYSQEPWFTLCDGTTILFMLVDGKVSASTFNLAVAKENS